MQSIEMKTRKGEPVDALTDIAVFHRELIAAGIRLRLSSQDTLQVANVLNPVLRNAIRERRDDLTAFLRECAACDEACRQAPPSWLLWGDPPPRRNVQVLVDQITERRFRRRVKKVKVKRC